MTATPLPGMATPCTEVDPEMFFPPKGGTATRAKKVCNGTGKGDACPILVSCLEWALQHEKEGVWGGTTPEERDKIRKKNGTRVKTVKYSDLVASTPPAPGHGSWSGINLHRTRYERNCDACRDFSTRQSQIQRAKKAS